MRWGDAADLELIRLRREEGLSWSALGKHFNRSRETIRQHYARAMRKHHPDIWQAWVRDPHFASLPMP